MNHKNADAVVKETILLAAWPLLVVQVPGVPDALNMARLAFPDTVEKAWMGIQEIMVAVLDAIMRSENIMHLIDRGLPLDLDAEPLMYSSTGKIEAVLDSLRVVLSSAT